MDGRWLDGQGDRRREAPSGVPPPRACPWACAECRAPHSPHALHGHGLSDVRGTGRVSRRGPSCPAPPWPVTSRTPDSVRGAGRAGARLGRDSVNITACVAQSSRLSTVRVPRQARDSFFFFGAEAAREGTGRWSRMFVPLIGPCLTSF